MSVDTVMMLGREGLQTVALLCLPALATSLLIGMLVSFTQAITQMQDQTLSFIPKIAAVGISLYLFGPWMLGVAVHFCHRCFDVLTRMGHA